MGDFSVTESLLFEVKNWVARASQETDFFKDAGEVRELL